ncbi:MAG: hypothetical protein ACKPKO_64080, partial [Candidatus Fonsibacter sp.]
MDIRQARCGHCLHPTCLRELHMSRMRSGDSIARQFRCPVCRRNTLRCVRRGIFFDRERAESDGGPGTPFSVHSVYKEDAVAPPRA